MHIPEWATRICDSFGKVGETPKYRVAWAPERTQLVFGKVRKVYPQIGERWIVEVLLPWEIFGGWNFEAFGPKPQDGQYSHLVTIQEVEGQFNPFDHTKKGEFISLDDFGPECLRLTLTVSERGRGVPGWQVTNNYKRLIEEDEKREHEQFENVYDDNLGEMKAIMRAADDAKIILPMFGGVPPGLKKAMALQGFKTRKA